MSKVTKRIRMIHDYKTLDISLESNKVYSLDSKLFKFLTLHNLGREERSVSISEVKKDGP